ncbi:MAG: SDR family oxidoreductase [Gemmatimonadaceae bacterium]|nr:SDR family oxidoreductase [Gemmatimonadaceae bacterium]
MKLVVIGGSGLIGRKAVAVLRRRGYEVLSASPSSGVDTVSGEGVAEALAGARVVVDATNAASADDGATLAFFETSTRNLLAAERAANVGHHVVLSIVGTERLIASGYFRAKLAQETLVRAAPIPWTIVRATQFFEFVEGIARAATEGGSVRVPPVLMQPVAADDVAERIADIALAEPLRATVEVAGPERIRQDDLVRRFLDAARDSRRVVADPAARYFGAAVDDRSLVPGALARLGATRFDDWLERQFVPGKGPPRAG